ncbi:MAG: FAD-dependent oxidoreductase [Elusimicrobiales bacterium]|nr:FAD-dependent oxidoreductase [Elusimicrobiales bacterium]
MEMKTDVLVLGGGLTGLAAAEALKDSGLRTLVLEKAAEPGGLSRTARAGEFLFDLGGHRLYFSKPEVRAYTERLLKGRTLLRPRRSSAIYTGGRLLNYPPTFLNGILYAAPVLFSKGRKASGARPPATLKDWLDGRLGPRIHDRYFRDYTRKVWGRGTDELSPLWAERRIGGGFSVKTLLLELFGGKLSSKENAARFLYPERGIGELPAALLESAGPRTELLTGAEPLELKFKDGRPAALVFGQGGGKKTVHFKFIISTIPLTALAGLIPGFPPGLAAGIKYRSLVVLFAALRRKKALPHHWVYFPDWDAEFSRLCELANWSPLMAPGGWLPVTFEFFCDEGDACWRLTERELLARALGSPAFRRLAGDLEAGPAAVERLAHAYPLLYAGSEGPLAAVKKELAALPNLLACGRTGAHAYLDTEECLLDAWAAADKIKKAL